MKQWAIDAWKVAGSQWKACNTRLISVTLKCGDERFYAASCYAPTRAASSDRKAKFYDSISSILCRWFNSYILMGDFIARIGSRE